MDLRVSNQTSTPIAVKAGQAVAHAQPAGIAKAAAAVANQIKEEAQIQSKIANSLNELSFIDEPPSLTEVVDQAILGLNSVRPFDFGNENIKPYAERAAEMQRTLNKALNDVIMTGSKKFPVLEYRYSNQEVKAQINQIAKKIQEIDHLLRSGVTDCWGGLTTSRSALKLALETLTQGLEERMPLPVKPWVCKQPMLKY